MKFISFGCWNKGDPTDPSLPLYHLLKSLEIRLYEGDIDFVMITGDNYYYHSEKEEEKGYPLTEYMELEPRFIPLSGGAEKKDKDSCDYSLLKETFNRINEISDDADVPIYMCSGNHEYKPHTILNKPPEKESPPVDVVRGPEEKEELLGYQKSLLKDSDTKYIEQDKLPYEEPPFYVINTEKDRLDMSFIKDEGGKHIYIFGHIPILSLNPKQKKRRIWDINGHLVTAFHRLAKKVSNITYICADTHNYQDIEIIFQDGKKVRQFVVGSGGTFKMDDLIEGEDLVEGEKKIQTDPKLDKFSSVIKSINLKRAFTGYHGFCVFDTAAPLAEPEFIRFYDAATRSGLYADVTEPEPEPEPGMMGKLSKKKISTRRKAHKRKKRSKRKHRSKRKSKRKRKSKKK